MAVAFGYNEMQNGNIYQNLFNRTERIMHDTNMTHGLFRRAKISESDPFHTIPSDTIHPKGLLLFKQEMLFFR